MSTALKQAAVTAETFLSDIDALLPAIRERAGETERKGEVSAEIVAMLAGADMFRAMQPRQWGGRELDAATFFEGAIRIASACGSTGWVASVVGVHPWHVALFDNAAQRDVWGGDPDARISTSYAPTGHGARVPGGFCLSGRWSFSSGVDHCDWVIVGAVVADAADGDAGPEFRSLLVRRGDFSVDHDSWNVTGLAGTGSKDVTIANAFVPEHRTHCSTQVYTGTNPGWEVNDRPLYRLPWSSMFAYAIACPAIGAAVGALDLFIENNRERVSAFGGPKLASNPGLHLRLADALTAVDAARTTMHATFRDFQAFVRCGQEIPYVLRAKCRYDAAQALAASPRAVYRVLEVSGGNTMRADNAFQRLFRDLLAMRNHPVGTIEAAASVYAQAKLGVKPPPFTRAQRVVI